MEQAAPSELGIPFQSDVSWQDALAQQLSARATAAVEALGSAEAAADAPSSGVSADGTRWWRESGTVEVGEGRLCTWTLLRGCLGGAEWQEKWWRTSDAWAYRELGAEKSGRDASGAAWREAWAEVWSPDAATGLGHIARTASKWGRDAGGAAWTEAWSEAFWADGRTERQAEKWGCLHPGAIPADGEAGEWREAWGERWAGGAASKWSDKWAQRAEREGGGPPRRWGERSRQEYRGGRGTRGGTVWAEDDGGARPRYNREWLEAHEGSGWVHKTGSASDGERWDAWAEEAAVYEAAPAFGWREAHAQVRQLLAVPLRSRT